MYKMKLSKFEEKLKVNRYTKFDMEVPRKRNFVSCMKDEKVQSHQKALEKTISISEREDPTPFNVIFDTNAGRSSKQDTKHTNRQPRHNRQACHPRTKGAPGHGRSHPTEHQISHQPTIPHLHSLGFCVFADTAATFDTFPFFNRAFNPNPHGRRVFHPRPSRVFLSPFSKTSTMSPKPT